MKDLIDLPFKLSTSCFILQTLVYSSIVKYNMNKYINLACRTLRKQRDVLICMVSWSCNAIKLHRNIEKENIRNAMLVSLGIEIRYSRMKKSPWSDSGIENYKYKMD